MNERTCIVTRQAYPAESLIRFVLAPDGTVVPDLKARLPGRGAWVRNSAAHVRTAMKRGLFARAFRRQVTVPADLDGQIDARLRQRALGALGMAMRAGEVVTGFAKVEALLRSGGARVLLHASDGAADGWRKLENAMTAGGYGPANGHPADPEAVFFVRELSGDDLGMALGRGHVIHAAVRTGGLAKAVEQTMTRWRRFRVNAPAVLEKQTDDTPANRGGGQESE